MGEVIEFRVPVSQIKMNSVCWVPLQTLRVQNTSEAKPYIPKRLLPSRALRGQALSARTAFQILTGKKRCEPRHGPRNAESPIVGVTELRCNVASSLPCSLNDNKYTKTLQINRHLKWVGRSLSNSRLRMNIQLLAMVWVEQTYLLPTMKLAINNRS